MSVWILASGIDGRGAGIGDNPGDLVTCPLCAVTGSAKNKATSRTRKRETADLIIIASSEMQPSKYIGQSEQPQSAYGYAKAAKEQSDRQGTEARVAQALGVSVRSFDLTAVRGTAAIASATGDASPCADQCAELARIQHRRRQP